MRCAVVKSGLRSVRRWTGSSASEKAISRSTMAPAEIGPAVGTPLVTEAPWPGGAEAADRQRALGHRIDLAVGAQHRGHQQGAAQQALGVAQRRDGDIDRAALGARRRGRVPVTMTAATFLVFMDWRRAC